MVINHIGVLMYQDDFLRMRSRLFALAYKMTKSVVDAEDIVQETFLAMGSVKAGTIREPEAYFVRAVTNRCLKVLDQRRATIYPGPDLVIWQHQDLLSAFFIRVNNLSSSASPTVVISFIPNCPKSVEGKSYSTWTDLSSASKTST